MAQIFVSHSSADNPLALRLRECLGDLGYDSVFLDFSPTDGLVPGAAWRDQLFTNLDRSDALVFVGTPTANASLWCHSELALARWLRKPVLSLLFDGVDPHELVADIQGINLASADLSPDAIHPGLVALGLEQATRWDASRSPFPGLRAFDESYAPVFFGRERQVDQLRQMVDPPSRARQGLVVPVLGPSGSGKSSLVRAGLVAALRPAPDWVVSEPWTPSDAPLAELSLALAHAAKRQEVALDADACNELLRTPGGMPEYLRRLRDGGSVPADARVLVVIDQAEELVTLTAESERKAFFEALALACTPPSPLRVVMTARTDMWDSVSALTNRFGMTVAPAVLHVPPLSRADLARVIAEPAKRSLLTLEDGLLQRLVEDTSSGDALPLLAYTLARMAADATDGRLTHEVYDKVGGVRGAIASRAAQVAHDARTEAEVAAAILHIVGTGENRPVTRLARVETVPPAQRAILDDLVDARLVVVRESAGVQVYAPAHEALFSAWPPLAEMISRRHDDLRLRSRLERRAADWHEAGTGSSGLLTGDELDHAGDWQRRSPDLQTADIASYVDASRHRERRNRILRVGVATVVTALALALVVVVLVNARADRRQAREARVGELTAIAERELVHNPPAAAVALLAALELGSESSQVREVADQLLASPARDVVPLPGGLPVVTLAAGGDLAVTNGVDEQHVWDLTTGELVGQLPTVGAVLAVRDDDRVAVTSSVDGIAWWDLSTADGTQLASVGRGAAKGRFSPDGTLLVTSSSSVVTLWNVSDPASPAELSTWQTLGSTVADVWVLDDGRVYTSGDEALLTEWRPLSGRPHKVVVAEPPPQAATVNAIIVDDAAAVALVSWTTVGQGVSVYDLSTGKVVQTFVAAPPGQTAGLTTWLATMDEAHSALVVFDIAGRGFAYEPDEATPIGELSGGHTASVSQAGFTSGGQLVTGSIDGTIRVWDPLAARRDRNGDIASQLCLEFGARIDEASQEAALGDDRLGEECATPHVADADAPLTVSSDLPDGVPVDDELVRDDFEDQYSLFPPGSYTLQPHGSSARSIDNGRMRVSTQGAPQGYTVWSTAPLSLFPDTFTVQAVVDTAGEGLCGLTVADSVGHLTAAVDPASGQGIASWFVPDQPARRFDFSSTPSADPVLGISRDSDGLAIRVDGNVARRIDDLDLGPPQAAGLVTIEASATCVFDDFEVNTP